MAAIVGIVFVLGTGVAHDLRVSAVLSGAPQEEVLVTAGESLWAIAERHTGDDVAVPEVVRWVMEENGLDSCVIQPGDRIVLPVLTS
ncbi:LysM peptidoglycan-binding domain-containing protein [Olsenella sp. YH-ols2217]|uniref:LysM peptidoglycan-binding domain-containing protein n=1 Tax=Kribbibacterium absianum TaxID=3044210 RepID=A0ABT6ZIV4_9ACTN|nr:LysM peptidoglycan-binding domain-containing protein [Olsenella sp. YH-ols2217]MDJ1121479.1 LysM peptidoglycan-binding domain-containing protein [Olsenella sp. YH-ols2216]MDJ1128969.1 LysM peptidoglycan-binding domain-containing protein [Olsenella sp. YH-ols2217]